MLHRILAIAPSRMRSGSPIDLAIAFARCTRGPAAPQVVRQLGSVEAALLHEGHLSEKEVDRSAIPLELGERLPEVA